MVLKMIDCLYRAYIVQSHVNKLHLTFQIMVLVFLSSGFSTSMIALYNFTIYGNEFSTTH